MSIAQEYVIDVSGLSKSFDGTKAVKGITLRVKRGEIFGFLGPNGCGKTTTIRMICGLLTPDTGHGCCLGHNLITEAHLIKQRVGYMTQKFSLYEDLTIAENLDFATRMYAVSDRKAAIDETLVKFDLADRRDQLAGSLSGGWKQRLALAVCLIHAPSLLLLDEPTAGVDPSARREFWNHIHELAASGITSLVTTHYMDEAEHCSRLAYMDSGKLLTEGSPGEIIQGAGLFTWSITGENIWELATDIASLPSVSFVAPFGASLHVSGHNDAALMRELVKYADRGFILEQIKTGLEDVFIGLIRNSGKEQVA